MSLSIQNWLAENDIDIPRIREFSSGQIAGLAFRIVQDMEVKSLSIFDICTLAEVLEQPLGAVWQEIPTFAQITQSIVNALSQKKPLKRNEGTWLAFQIAYLRGLHQILKQEYNLRRPWLDRVMIWDTGMRIHGDFPLSPPPPLPPSCSRPLQDAQLQGLLKTFRPGKLTDTQAEQALSLVADSLLVQQMSNAAVAWIIANSGEEAQAKLIIQRLVNSLSGHLLAVIAENAPPFAQLQKFFRLGNSLASIAGAVASNTLEVVEGATPTGSTAGDTIDLYREVYRASLIQSLSQPLFIESFSLKDIYVPPKGLPLEKMNAQSGQKISRQIDLMTWAHQQLSDLETMAVIESEPGYGKTSFCQIWAAKVAQELYPKWMPVLINLSQVTVGNTIEETLNSSFQVNSRINFLDWLKLKHPKCLLILDGLDELPPSYQKNRAKVIFLQQLLNLQSKRQHKIFLTCQSKTLQETVQELPPQFKRITIEPWEQDELRLWFQQWATVQSLPIAQNFFSFLKQAGLFSSKSKLPELSVFVRQPLMLYLLGILHRDGLLGDEIFELVAKTETAKSASLVWEIYHRLSKWLLGYPQAGGIKTTQMRWGSSHVHRTQEAITNLLQSRHPQEVLKEIQAVALQILHSQRYQVSLTDELNIEKLPAFYFRVQDLDTSRKDAKASQRCSPQRTVLLRRRLASQRGLIGFSHAKLGEYICAQALIDELKRLTLRMENAYGELSFVLESPSSVAQYIYNLLGYGILTQEIEELVIEGLRREEKCEFSFESLSNRLLPFWYSYCRGRWLDDGIAHKALTHFQTLENPITVEQVNAAVGLNVFLLLCAIHLEAKIPFFPGGEPAFVTEFNPEAMMMLIGRTAVFGKNTFVKRLVSKPLAFLNLSGVYLPQVMLAGADLRLANLSHAELIGANLVGASLQKADFTSANLMGANLSGANLMSANLTGANLTEVNLSCVNLTNTCLFQAILSDADKDTALNKGAIFSLEQFRAMNNLLSPPLHPNTDGHTEHTAAWTNNPSEKVLIESVEGEPLMPEEDVYDDYVDDETFVNNNLDYGSH